MNHHFRGIVPPLLTPLTEAGEIDVPSLERLTEHLVASGVQAGCTDAHGVVDRADRGDLIARGVVDGAAAALGRAVAGIVTVWDPHVVVVGGGVAGAGPRWWEVLRSTARAELVEVLADVEIRPAALGARAALVGAADTARQALATKEDG